MAADTVLVVSAKLRSRHPGLSFFVKGSYSWTCARLREGRVLAVYRSKAGQTLSCSSFATTLAALLFQISRAYFV
jgi:hypothetical protein